MVITSTGAAKAVDSNSCKFFTDLVGIRSYHFSLRGIKSVTIGLDGGYFKVEILNLRELNYSIWL